MNCKALSSVTIPESVTSIKDYAFADCHALTTITIPKSVTSIKYTIFHNCDALTSIYVPADSPVLEQLKYRYGEKVKIKG